MVNLQADAIGHILPAYLAGVVVSLHDLLAQILRHPAALSPNLFFIDRGVSGFFEDA